MLSSVSTYFGPPLAAAKKGRSVMPFSSNRAASYVPSILFNSAPDRLKEPVETLLIPKPVTSSLLHHLKQDIQNHVEARFHLFFQHALLLFNTKLQITKHHTYLQIGQAVSGYAAAHDSTFPSLVVTNQIGSVILGAAAELESAHNATMFLPVIVNQMDSRIDGHHRKMKVAAPLRKLALTILNQVSDGSINPSEAMVQFIDAFAMLSSAAKRAKPSKTGVKKHEVVVLRSYQKVAKYYKRKWGDHLIRKLCFAPDGQTVDLPFFTSMQGQMHQALIIDTNLRPIIVQAQIQRASISLQPGTKTKKNQKKVTASYLAIGGDAALTKSLKKYSRVCLKSLELLALAIDYLAKAKPKVIKQDLTLLPQIKTSATLDDFDLSKTAVQLHTKALGVIRAATNQDTLEPQKMGTLLIHVLHKIT